MNTIKRDFLLVSITLVIAMVPFLVMVSRDTSLSLRLVRAEREITHLNRQLARQASQRCHQTYQWESTRNYPASLVSSGITRTYRVHTPPSYTADQRYPVIIVFDGLDGTSLRAEHESGLNATPALTVYPDALIGTTGATAWQGAPYSPVGVNDVQFIDDMMTQLSNDFCIDRDAVYMVGMSNGAGFAFLAACELHGKIAGVAGISGAYYQQCPADRMPTRTLYLHSREDTLVPYEGNPLRRLPPIYTLARNQGHAAGCRQMLKASSRTVEQFSWYQCQDQRHVSLMITREQPHGWLKVADTSLVPEGALSRRTTSAIIWDFFTDKK